jgi:hypothetical protein
MDVDNAPREIWIPTYGTDSLFDDWFADPDMASEDDVKYIRADITGAEIRRLEDIIAQMSAELTDACMAADVNGMAYSEMAEENERLMGQLKQVLGLFGLPSTHIADSYLDAIGDIIQEHCGFSWRWMRGLSVDARPVPKRQYCLCNFAEEEE